MNRRITTFILAGLMIASGLAAVSAQAPISMGHNGSRSYASHSSVYNGNVTIGSNGVISFTGTGNVKPLTASSASVFQINENINGTLVDMMNGSTIIGNGYGINSTGIYLNHVSGISISDLNLSDRMYGINIFGSSNIALSGINFNASSTEVQAVSISLSSSVSITGSTFAKDPAIVIGTLIYAEQTNFLSVQNNSYNGPEIGPSSDFLSTYYTYNVKVENNLVVSSSPTGNAFSFSKGGSVKVGNNMVTNLTGINAQGLTDLTTFGNVFKHSPNQAITASNIGTFSSTGDAIFNTSGQDMLISDSGSITINGGTFNNSTFGILINNYRNLTFDNNEFSSTYPGAVIALVGGGNTSINHSSICVTQPSGYVINDNSQSVSFSLTNSVIYDPLGPGILVAGAGSSVTVSNVSVTSIGGVKFTGQGFNSVYVANSSFIEPSPGQGGISVSQTFGVYSVNIYHNSIATLTGTSSTPGVSVTNPSSYTLNIVGNKISNFSYGIEVQYNNNLAYSTSLISGNTLVNLSEFGVYFHGPGNLKVSNNNVLNSVHGIYASDSNGPVAIEGNSVINDALTSYSLHYGIFVSASSSGIISNNVMSGSGYQYGTGITYAFLGDSLITGNTVSEFNYGIFSTGYNGPTILQSNTVSETYYGIYITYDMNTTIYGNTVNDANISLFLYQDPFVKIVGNTIQDRQSNDSSLSLFSISSVGTQLLVYHNNFLNYTTNSTVRYSLSNIVGLGIFNLSKQVGGNYWSNYTGTGTNGIGSTPYKVGYGYTDYYPLTSNWTSAQITFVETGLPAGTAWSVSLGSSYLSSTTSMITFQQEYGQQTNLGYSISSVNGYTVSASMGSVNENGKSQTVMVSYSPVMYNVTVKENNLPPGTMWSASLNGTMQSSSSGSITFQVPNGTYSFSVPSIKGYHPSVRNGTVTVKGSSVSETVTFIPDTYTIVVKEKGLPFGEGWTVSVNGTNYTTNGTSISVKEVAGTYNVTISAPSGYTASQSSYNVSLNVSNSTLQVTFSGNSKNTASGLSGTSLYAGIGIGAAVGVIGSFGAVTAVTGQFPWRLRRK